MHPGSGERSSIRAADSRLGRFDGTRTRAPFEWRDHHTESGASKPVSSRLKEFTHWFVIRVSSRACASMPARKARPTSESGSFESGE